MISNISPLRYPGGKTRGCKKLDDILTEYFKIEEYNNIISPFIGGGSFEFYMQNKYGMNIIGNDIFEPLSNFWYTCKHNKTELCDKLYKKVNNIDKCDFLDMRKQIMKEQDKLKQSVMFFVINRCSFSGATLSGGYSKQSSNDRFTESSVNRVNNLNLTDFTIDNSDYEEFLEKNRDDKSLIYLDPPYYLESGSKLYGVQGSLHEGFDHERLYKCVSKRINWIMTYNNCDYIKELYKDYTIIETSWAYGMNSTKKSSEIVIISNK